MNETSLVQVADCPTCGKKPPYCQCHPTAAIVKSEHENVVLSAKSPEEMVQCHSAAIAWCKNKISLIQTEADELKAAFEHALKAKWASSTLKRHWELAKDRIVFYEKMLAAFEAGYFIVPNFPVTLFAIRTDRPKPSRMWARLRYSSQKNFEQKAKELPVGEGQYRNPQPIIENDWSEIKDEHGNITKGYFASEWMQKEFPANMARVHVMEAATGAMDKKIFDEVGFLPQDYRRNADPVMIGRIIDPRAAGYGLKRRVSFMIAWHIDTRTL